MLTTRDAASESDVLYEFALNYERPDPQQLDDFVRRYPSYADALTILAIELVIDQKTAEENAESVCPEPDAEMTAMLSRAMSRFQNRLFSARAENTSMTSENPIATDKRTPRNPFSSLTREQTRIVMTRLDVSPLFFMRLRDCEISAETMTPGFIRHVAEGTDEPEALVVAHFSGAAQIQSHVRFKSEVIPTVQPKISFAEAVRSSGLTPEQQARLLSL